VVTTIGRTRQEHGGILSPLTASIARRVADERAGQVQPRDPGFVRRLVAPTARYLRYFSPEVRGIENIPASGPVLLVGNHSCLFYMPDAWAVSLAITARRGADAPAYAMVYDLLFGVPVVGSALRRLGGLPAAECEAERVLAQGALVVVYPGGDAEACRPWAERNRIEFGGHTGFVRVALRSGVPVVPVVTHGSHDAVVVLARGERLARALGLDRLRIKVFPIILGPLGVTSILTPPLPMPSAVTIEFMAPIDWSALGPAAADDEAVVGACYKEVTSAMQATLDRLHTEHPHPVLRGWSRLLRGGAMPVEISSTPTSEGEARAA
jgi:1-acyl-sn-glycerol-3-phosphate acyltransferase